MAVAASAGVVGAGAAGLSAALTLARAGVQVTVYEQADRAGGLLRTETVGGARVDVAVQLVSSKHTALQALARDAGAGGLLRRSPGRDALWRKGRAHPITYGSVASMLTSGALPATLKLKLGARYLPYLTTHVRGLDANDLPGSGGAALDRETIGVWGARELGADFVELLVYPLLAAYYGTEPERTSAAVYHALAREGMDITVQGAAGGFGALADRVRAALEQRGGRFVFGTAVTAVDSSHDRARVLSDGAEAEHDAVVIATPANRVAALLNPAAELRAWLEAVQVRPTVTVALRMDRPFPGDYFGLSFPRSSATGRQIAALCIQGRKLPGLVQEGDALLTLPAPPAVDRLLEMSDDEVVRTQLDALEDTVSGISGRVASAHVFRFADAYTLFDRGSIIHLTRLQSGWLPRRVALAGAWLMAPSVEGAVRSGKRAAQRLLASFGVH